MLIPHDDKPMIRKILLEHNDEQGITMQNIVAVIGQSMRNRYLVCAGREARCRLRIKRTEKGPSPDLKSYTHNPYVDSTDWR